MDKMLAKHTGIASVPSREGGVGIILDTGAGENLCLKVFYRRNRDFWAHVRSVQEWTGRMRFIAGCTKLPVALRFWIHRDDAWTRTPFNQMHLSKVIWSAQAFAEAKDEALKAVSPDQYILCSEEQLASIYQDDNTNNKRCNVRLLATYPVQKRECSVKDIIDRQDDEFTREEILRAFYQILCSIEYIYRSGCAHSDIKPGNILVNTDENGKRNFFLNDYDSFNTPEAPSTSATPGFFPKDCAEELKKKFPKSYRILYDCYALAVTILCMAEKLNSPDYISVLSLRSDKLPEQVKRLYQITSFDPENIADIIKELEEKCGCERQSCDYCGADITSYEFDRKQSYRIGEFGYFHEQILLSKFRDPLWMIPNCYINVPQELSDILLMPLGHYGLNTFLHAPDDAGTGKRPVNFENYIPKTLSNTSLSSAEKEILLDDGRRLNEYFDAAECRSAYLPQKDHIIWCDGTLKILWGLGSELDTPINYEDYFRWLVGEDVRFSYQDWRTLLPHEYSLSWNASPEYWQSVLDEVVEEYSKFHCLVKSLRKDYDWLYEISEFKKFVIRRSNALSLDGWLCYLPNIPELADKLNDDVCKQLLSKAVDSDYKGIVDIPAFKDFVIQHAKELTEREWLCYLQHIPELEKKLTVKICRQLLTVFSEHVEYSRLFGYKNFRKKIADEVLNFSTDHWMAIREYTKEFDDRITDADMIWQMYQRSTATQKKELLQNPPWACVIQDKTANDPKAHFRNFFRGQRYDRETFLKFYPQQSHTGLSGRIWGNIIAVNPELIYLLPPRIFSFLNRKAWVRILGVRPDLAERCEKWESFSASEWVSILVQQPDFKRFVPDSVHFSSDERTKIEEKSKKNRKKITFAEKIKKKHLFCDYMRMYPKQEGVVLMYEVKKAVELMQTVA